MDRALQQLIIDLNEAGWKTADCCQGRMSPQEFARPRRHCAFAWIGFVSSIQMKIVARLNALDLGLFNDFCGLSANLIIPSTTAVRYRVLSEKGFVGDWGTDEEIQAAIKLNYEFPLKARQGFELL